MVDIKELRNNLNVKAVFRLSESLDYVGDLKDGKNSVERMKLVLTQTFDALGIRPFRQMIITGKDQTILLSYHNDEEIGVVFSNEVDVEDILRFVYEERVITGKEEVEAEEVEEVVVTEEVKGVAEAEEVVEVEEVVETEEVVEVEEVVEAEEVVETEEVVEEVATVPESVEETAIKIEKQIVNPVIIERIKKIAEGYLGDFSLDIVSNVIEDSELNEDSPTKDQVLEVTNLLKSAASLIIGPSKASGLEEEILKAIEEEG
ncbi:hypothetical protein KAW18_05250 [candidate division WOR-3 bacterium]|nr:hypothetical protein [candidate division WOR-3 bacterium]MCK4526758.1 hypothetical protein [candidate division WOR-3 bacterium]